jgi:hypothetical protein
LLLALVATGCSSKRGGNAESLRALHRLSADQSSFGVILDAKTGKALAAVRVNSPIQAAIPDGDGGWYIGGGFIRVNGVLRKRLAHIDRDGRLDPKWKPEANGNGVSVSSLARIGSRLYVAGDFAELNHRPRAHLGAFDVRTGRLNAWRPAERRPYWYDVLLAADGRLLVGGGDCCAETALVALDAKTGSVDSRWRVRVDASALEGGSVRMLSRDGSRIIVSGMIRSIDGVPGSLAAVDAATGRLDPSWRPPAGCCTLLALAAGRDRVYGSINGPAKYQLMALGRNARPNNRWHARVSSTTGFYGAAAAEGLAVAAGRVYATGDFDRINSVRRNGFAALDGATARVLPSWQPRASTVYGSLLAPSRTRLLLGISLARTLRFDFTGLKTYRPVRTLRLVLALSGPGKVRIGLGRSCDVQRWENSSSLRCDGRLLRSLATVSFERAERKRYVHRLGVPPGRYFVHFVPQSLNGVPQPNVQDFPIAVP